MRVYMVLENDSLLKVFISIPRAQEYAIEYIIEHYEPREYELEEFKNDCLNYLPQGISADFDDTVRIDVIPVTVD